MAWYSKTLLLKVYTSLFFSLGLLHEPISLLPWLTMLCQLSEIARLTPRCSSEPSAPSSCQQLEQWVYFWSSTSWERHSLLKINGLGINSAERLATCLFARVLSVCFLFWSNHSQFKVIHCFLVLKDWKCRVWQMMNPMCTAVQLLLKHLMLTQRFLLWLEILLKYR